MSEGTNEKLSQSRTIHDNSPGSVLISLAERRPERYHQNPLLGHEKRLVHQICATEQPWSTEFSNDCFDVVSIAVKKRDWELIEIILSYDTSKCLLSREPNILYLLLTGHPAPFIGPVSDEDLDRVRRLILHGTEANYEDSNGNSLLCFCLTMSCHRVLRLLVASGADPYTLHRTIEDSPQNPSLHVNLLQRYLDQSLKWLSNLDTSFWMRRRDKDEEDIWGDMMVTLLNYGLEVDCTGRNTNILVQMLCVACSQENTQLIQMLIGIGVDVKSTSQTEIASFRLASPLHAAAITGRKKSATILISCGANVRCKAYHTNDQIGRQYSPIEACLAVHIDARQPIDIECAEVCTLLVEAGASNDDATSLLRQCIRHGYLDSVAHLIDLGVRVDEMPEMPLGPPYDDVIKYLVESGIPYDPVDQCIRAFNSEDLEWIKRLMHQHGTGLITTNLPRLQDFIYGPSAASPSNLDYLVSQHGFDVNKTFPVIGPGSYEITNLLVCACKSAIPPRVQMLLRLGAAIDCPGTSHTAFGFLGKGRHLNVRFDSRELDIFKMFVSVHDPSEPATDMREIMRRLIALETSKEPRNMETQIGMEKAYEGNLGRLRRVDHAPTPERDCAIYASGPHIDFPHPQTTKRFQHSVLSGLQSMRLVNIHPAKAPLDPIFCDMIHTNLYGQPKFNVLSFDRISEGDRQVPVHINDGYKMVSEVLWCALSRVREVDQPVVIYMQELCVDETNILERNHQKNMLRSIYSEAAQLCVYLGKISDPKKEEEKEVRYDSEDDPEYDSEDEIGRYVDGYYGDDPDAFPESESDDNEHDYPDAGENVDEDIINQPWFYRPRSYLEFQTIKSMIYYHGNDEINFDPYDVQEPFQRELPVFWDTLQSLLADTFFDVDYVVNGDMHMRSADIREDIFDILILLDENSVEIDYSLPTSFLLKEFTKVLFQRQQLLLPLYKTHAVVTHSMAAQPSWIPNYRLMGHDNKEDTSYNGHRGDVSDCSRLRFEGDDMIIDGLLLGKIEEVGSVLQIQPGNIEIAETSRSWESVAVNAKLNGSVKHLANMFFAAIEANICDEVCFRPSPGNRILREESSTCEYALEQVAWYKKFGTGILKELDPDFFSAVEVYSDWIKETADPMIFDEIFKIVGVGNRFFRTDHGIMGLACAEAQKDDEIAFLTGSKYPFIVRRAPSEKGEMKYRIVGNCYGPMDIITWESKKGLKAPDPPQYQEFIIC
ncbi:hypothetical protein BU24DRAFT_277832 [Aaosphaeria arxii CBS 175.79]|uniref:Heterokaryon incompatibility domain-containing protein n=1 Tax=Aaosphaeria arxii CBS 175.79 TaxID=1450172 RepID=A0A6A5XDQ3_9PLEO|nr:uncharacterized protein BU24DRAFT_277832 [Aaosphaeria arxii CBS 175.79]KAF2011275.1 hypothetical protein BU24DRAFT_277832 [Aaosphaeria arxii CBS 175.79]